MTAAPRTVSVVIPVKDDADHLEICLRALAQQSEAPLEIIVVDNDSSDDTAEVAQRHGVEYVFETAQGIPAAASCGYDAARGEIIARLDADSVPPVDWVQRVRAALDDDLGLSAVTGPGDFPELARLAAWLARTLYMRPYFRVFERRLGHPPVFGSNFAMTRLAWLGARERVHRHDPEVHDDLDLSYALGPGSRVLLDTDLCMPISARPFGNPIAFMRRVHRGHRTVVLNRDARRTSIEPPALPA